MQVKDLFGIKSGLLKLWYRNHIPQAQHDSLLDAMIEMHEKQQILPDPRSIVYAEQMVTEVTFSFVSATINLVRDEDSTRDICEGRVCFYPFDSDPKAVLDPDAAQLDNTCPSGPSDSDSASPSDKPSVSASPSDSASPSKLNRISNKIYNDSKDVVLDKDVDADKEKKSAKKDKKKKKDKKRKADDVEEDADGAEEPSAKKIKKEKKKKKDKKKKKSSD